MVFTIDVTPRARQYFKALRKRDQQTLADAIAVHLTHQPDRPTRNRKPVEENLPRRAARDLRGDRTKDAQRPAHRWRVGRAMKVVAVEEATLTLPELAELAKTGPIILARRGKPLAAVKDLSRTDWESVSLANNRRFEALIEESRRSYREQGGIRLEDLREELGLKAPPRCPRRKKKA